MQLASWPAPSQAEASWRSLEDVTSPHKCRPFCEGPGCLTHKMGRAGLVHEVRGAGAGPPPARPDGVDLRVARGGRL